jgi:iron complex outermembrane recepter protein
VTLGLIVEPVKGWSTTLDYFRISVDNQIIPAAALTSYDPVGNGVRGTPQQVTFGDGRTGLSPVGPFAYSASPYVNGQRTETSGLEFETRYRIGLGELGELGVGFQIAHMLKYTQTIEGQSYELAGTHGPTAIGGNTGNPRNRAQFTLNYSKGPFSATTTFNHVGSFDVTDPSVGITDCANGVYANPQPRFPGSVTPPERFCRVDAFVTANLSLRYQASPALSLRGAVTNLFDKGPPVDMSTYGGSGGSAYNPSLHQAGAVGRAFSLGMDYKF